MLSSAAQGVVISRALRWGCRQAARSNSTRNQLVALESLKLENFFCFVLFSFGGNMFSYNKKLAMWLVWFCVPFPASVGIKASSGFGSTFKSFEENKNIKKKESLFFFPGNLQFQCYKRNQTRCASITAVFILFHRSLIKKLKVLCLSWKAAAKPTEFSYQRRISKSVSKISNTEIQCLGELCLISEKQAP